MVSLAAFYTANAAGSLSAFRDLTCNRHATISGVISPRSSGLAGNNSASPGAVFHLRRPYTSNGGIDTSRQTRLMTEDLSVEFAPELQISQVTVQLGSGWPYGILLKLYSTEYNDQSNLRLLLMPCGEGLGSGSPQPLVLALSALLYYPNKDL